ncbi:hypothetical protein ACQP1G_12780 [Nocardia sp. CA-107356]|uniref:hypothetical protein n=1 Tax=Nocardia sp. CA-107356 TaxID=3239972 RepID=UPI003D8AC4C0
MSDNETSLRDLEIRALQDVIDAVDAHTIELLANGAKVSVPRSKLYARVIYAVFASARESGHYGAGMLANAPLLDVILNGAEGTDCDAQAFAALINPSTLN